MGQTLRLKVPSVQQVVSKADGKQPAPVQSGAKNGQSSSRTSPAPNVQGSASSSSSSSAVAVPVNAKLSTQAAPVPTAAKRRDTKAMKHAMLSTLGARGPDYWSIMKRFMQGHINRVELEALTAKLLTPANRPFCSSLRLCAALC